MEISWSDVNFTRQPGMHALKDGQAVQVTAKHIVQWTDDPEGRFGTYWYSPGGGRQGQYTLTDFLPSKSGRVFETT
jgi:hypothetical protein